MATMKISITDALARGMTRFTAFLGAERVDASAVAIPLLRERLAV